MKVAYVRVSTIEQNEARQVEALEPYGIEKWFTEKVSAKDTDRPKLQEMLSFVREGDIVYIHSFDRLARNTIDLLTIVETLKKKKVQLISVKDNIDFNSDTGMFMLTILGAVAELERNILRERQREGIAIAKKQGKFKGRKPIEINVNQWEELYEDMTKGYISKDDMAEKLGMSISTLYRKLKEYEEKEGIR